MKTWLVIPLLMPTAMRAPILSLSEYRALIASSRRAAEEGLTPQRAGRIGDRLRRIQIVSYPDGQQVAVDNKELTVALLRGAGGSASARRVAAARLRTLDALLSAPGRDRNLSVEPRQQAADILAADEFKRAFAEGARHENTWWDRQWSRLGEFIARLLRSVFGRGGPRLNGSGALGRNVLFLLYFLAIVAGVLALRMLATAVRRRRAKKGRRAGMSLTDLSEDSGPDPLRMARERAAAGDYRAALRLTYLACLRRLSAEGLLTLEEDKTNWEYQRALRRRSASAYDTLLPVTLDFDRIWYGRTPATREEYERAVAAHDSLPRGDRVPGSVESAGSKAEIASRRRGTTQQGGARSGENPW